VTLDSSFTADSRAARERLDAFLAIALARPRSQAQRLVKAGLVRVNGRTERPSYLMQVGDNVSVTEPPAAATRTSAPDLPVVYEDADLLVIDKPAGLVVHPGAGAAASGPSVADYARSRTSDPDPDRPGIVHRLDRDTSGLLIIAKTPEVKAYLQAAFKKHQVHKTYQLLLVGHPAHDQAMIKLPLGRHHSRPLQQAVVSGGREAVTGYQVVRAYPGYALVEAHPQSGRTHQLRVHFAALGHPVVGDTLYGRPERQLGLRRQFLHAAGLRFTAPSGAALDLHSPLPADLQQALSRLGATGGGA
jgi:23S rRNA pseudouridine1911/1915/1917 synthase